MPRLADTHGRAFGLLEVARDLLEEKGPRGLSLRALAEGVRISVGTLCDHFGSRRRVLHLLCQLASDDWVRELESQVLSRGVAGLLPADADDDLHARLWASWIELSRSDPELRGTVGDVRLEERTLLARAIGRAADDEDYLDLVQAVVDGLRHRIVAPVDPMPRDRAQVLLGHAVARAASAA